MTIKHSFIPTIPHADVRECGTTNFCSWERLLPSLQQACGLKPTEQIRGIVIDEAGIKIMIEKKGL
jgi:hypothetical protein